MPYKSDAQRRFMHAKHPKIARKWDREEKVQKDFASRMESLISKMDDDEAQVFSYLVMAEVLEDTIEKNQRTLQTHLDTVISKRIERVKKALLTSVSKSGDNHALAYAEAIREIEKAYKNPYETGAYSFQESDFRRDARTGRFQAKVNVNPKAKAMDPKQARGMGIRNPEKNGYKLTREQRAQYQQEYLQVSNFLNAIASSGEDADAILQVENKNSGARHMVRVGGKPKAGTDGDWDPKQERVIGVKAKPTGLTAGGSAFGLVSSLGGDMSGNTAQTINRADRNFGSFSNDWNATVDERNTNARLYGNISAGSKFVTQVAPHGSAAQIAGRMGQIVGDHGAQAEKVFGPAARKTAYRYRGTEKAPDAELTEAYDRAVRGSARRGLLRSEQIRGQIPLSPDERKRLRTYENRAFTRAREAKAAQMNRGKTRADFTPIEAVDLTAEERKTVQNEVRRRFDEARTQEPGAAPEQASGLPAGREVVSRHLRDRMPSPDLYNLQLDAGVTPPSEGILIDKDGQIVTQAIGYGDDHYLPFNLKHMKRLRGGEYIRTRSVGGPTSEDIYTGLMLGANRLQVESRSGTFVVEFADDFKGGRRYNDKAARMVRRYEKILDSVQSEAVDKEPIKPEIRAAITDAVRSEREGWPSSEIKEEINRRLDDYKHNPDLSGPNKAALDRYIDIRTSGMDDSTRQRVAGQLRNEWQAEREYKYRLNGEGYGAALKALQEQFPYYIKTTYAPKHELERAEFEQDKGYVEPGRNRPTKANAGWHGTGANKGSGFISASQTNYQRGKFYPTTKPSAEAPAPVAANGEAKPTGDKRADVAAKIAQGRAQNDYVESAVKTFQELQPAYAASDPEAKKALPLLGLSETEFREKIKNPQTARQFDDMLVANDYFGDALNSESKTAYQRASSKIGRQEYEESSAFVAGKPRIFPEYEGADQAKIQREVEKVDHSTPISQNKRLSEMDEEELKTEINALAAIDRAIKQIDSMGTQLDLDDKEAVLANEGVPLTPGARELVSNPDKLKRTLKDVHRMRSLNVVRSGTGEQNRIQQVFAAPAQGEQKITANLNEAVTALQAVSAKRLAADPSDPVGMEMAAAAVDAKDMLKEPSQTHDQSAWDTFMDQHKDVVTRAYYERGNR